MRWGFAIRFELIGVTSNIGHGSEGDSPVSTRRGQKPWFGYHLEIFRIETVAFDGISHGPESAVHTQTDHNGGCKARHCYTACSTRAMIANAQESAMDKT